MNEILLNLLEKTKDRASKISIIYLLHKFIEHNPNTEVPLNSLEEFRDFISQNIIQFTIGNDKRVDKSVLIKQIRIPLNLLRRNKPSTIPVHVTQPDELVSVNSSELWKYSQLRFWGTIVLLRPHN